MNAPRIALAVPHFRHLFATLTKPLHDVVSNILMTMIVS